jgi:hypothetical protein
MLLRFRINGDPVEVNLKAGDRLLVEVLREDLRLTGTKHGCGIGACGTFLPAARRDVRGRGCAYRRGTRRDLAAAPGAARLRQQIRIAMRHLHSRPRHGGVCPARTQARPD